MLAWEVCLDVEEDVEAVVAVVEVVEVVVVETTNTNQIPPSQKSIQT